MNEDVLIAFEPFTPELAAEILPLGQKCWNESTVVKAESCAFYGEREFQIEPDVEQYRRIAAVGMLLVLTFRVGKRLQGYGMAILYRTLHHRKIIVANVDTFYLEPGYRTYAAVMVDKLEVEFKKRGARAIGWPTHIRGSLYQLLKGMGYSGDDIIMEKQICA